MLDLVIEGALVVDGSGRAGGRADVGVLDEIIVEVGDLSREHAGSRLNASGKVVAPGFIDIHSHSEWWLPDNPRAESKVRQGVTTEVVGNCGCSPAPADPRFHAELRRFAPPGSVPFAFEWPTFRDYLAVLDKGGLALNVVHLVGHGALRIAAMGDVRRAPDDRELRRMQRLLAEAMEDGAWGLSSGLADAPGSYADTAELVTLAAIAARHRGIYATHVRGASATLSTAIDEAIAIGRDADLPVQVSHLNAVAGPGRGPVADGLTRIDAANADGVDVAADVYPYAAPSPVRPEEAVADDVDGLALELDEVDLRRALVHPRVMIASDGSVHARHRGDPRTRPHPRSAGTFPRVLGEYVREQRLFSLAQAIHKMTGMPAARLALRDRGLVRARMKADLVILDPRRVADRATFGDPYRSPDGIEHVLVAGRFVVKHGAHTGSLPGRVLTPP
jgi:N-acyl-D-amino-acid deacylase